MLTQFFKRITTFFRGRFEGQRYGHVENPSRFYGGMEVLTIKEQQK